LKTNEQVLTCVHFVRRLCSVTTAQNNFIHVSKLEFFFSK